ncbi:hypothetical protein H8F06_21530 [Vibrio fluvialis]|jgi:hypothetical protein|uniref:hypothetical protein n=1 Tax=Vibrio TaxID=662 RepID=UPI001159DB3A|nr:MULTISPECIES: hypothetical protein [Vibrio]EKO3611974.1 hypothetical protein [Vibrio metschnikovii]MBL4297864.1 hypothetical protein [Vibrio fluvialis]TQP63476.1 hypothetical protein FLL95_01495 [Vibrio cholerae]HDY7818549.1 hypothetical protein [Vibrio vulnificus]
MATVNTLYSATRINSINDSAMVLVNGKYQGQTMPMSDLRSLLKMDADVVIWTRKVLVKGEVVEKEMVFEKSSLIVFAETHLTKDVLEQPSTSEWVDGLRTK